MSLRAPLKSNQQGYDLAASKRVSELPKGTLKDVAICEMVRWLVGKGSADEASAWIAEISDNGLREKMVTFAGNQRRMVP